MITHAHSRSPERESRTRRQEVNRACPLKGLGNARRWWGGQLAEQEEARASAQEGVEYTFKAHAACDDGHTILQGEATFEVACLGVQGGDLHRCGIDQRARRESDGVSICDAAELSELQELRHRLDITSCELHAGVCLPYSDIIQFQHGESFVRRRVGVSCDREIAFDSTRILQDQLGFLEPANGADEILRWQIDYRLAQDGSFACIEALEDREAGVRPEIGGACDGSAIGYLA